jgi:hypothetical protein
MHTKIRAEVSVARRGVEEFADLQRGGARARLDPLHRASDFRECGKTAFTFNRIIFQNWLFLLSQMQNTDAYIKFRLVEEEEEKKKKHVR